jgi:predicted permease
MASPGYFETLQVPILSGRDFGVQDDDRAPMVAVVNQPFVDQYWPGRDPLGRRVFVADEWRTVVGVVAGFMTRRLGEQPGPLVVLPMAQAPRYELTLMARTANDAANLAPTLRRIVQEIDPQLPLYAVQTLQRHIDGGTFAQRAAASMLSWFGALALVLAAVGTYGVIAYNVSQRTRELGIRMALGAPASALKGMLLRQVLALVAVGVALGVGGAAALTRLMASLLFGVTALDAATYVSVSAALFATALLAGYLPARRVTRIDPMQSLRAE